MTGRCVRGNISSRALEPVAGPISIGTTVIASAPARIDLSGGWSDTPPISYENGGAVANLAVTVDERSSSSSEMQTCKRDGWYIASYRTISGDELISHTEVRIHQLNDMKDYNNPFGKGSLLKCALIYLGIVTIDEIDSYPSRSIQPYVENLCQREKLNMKAGLEVVSTSYLPTGSGMGGSSILGGCIVAAIARCIGIELQNDDLVKAVLMLENMMTTGGTPIYFASLPIFAFFILTVCCILLSRWVARPNWWIVWRAQTGNF
jgi:fucokinase